VKVTRIDHVGVLVGNLDDGPGGLPTWMQILGLARGGRDFVQPQKTEAQFAHTAEGEGGAKLELIASRGNEALDKFLEKAGGRATMHHLCFAVDDLASALKELDAAGVPLIDKVPRPGALGHLVAFLHPKATGGVLVELIQDQDHA
jgi:methylmalonyl-CoA/ethylmalonyl-CoA epimerase